MKNTRQYKAGDVIIRPIEENEPVPHHLLFDADPSRALVDGYLPASMVFVAILDDKVIGVYVLYPIDSSVIEIKNIAVAGELQGKGIGTLMLKDAAEQSGIMGFSTIIIGTGNSSVGQLYLYQKMGYEITGIRKNFFTDNYREPLYENGIQVKHMVMLEQQLTNEK